MEEIKDVEMQKPVAWMSSRNGFICKENKNPEYNIPLYPHPQPKAATVPEDWRAASDLAQELAAEFRGTVARHDYEVWGERVLPLLDKLTFMFCGAAPSLPAAQSEGEQK